MEGTVVITGGDGFVGRHLSNELATAWPKAKVAAWDLPAVDVTKPETFSEKLKDIQPAWVVHLAAVASVPAALKDPSTAKAVNVEGTRNLFEALQRHVQHANVLFASTADIYGMTANQYGSSPISELPLSEAQPANPYAASKLAAEQMIEKEFHHMCLRVRPFPHIGPKQSVGFVTADFASQIAAIEAGKQEPVMNVGNLEAVRDFTDVRDVVRAYRLLMEKGNVGEVYHVASGQPTGIQQVLDLLLGQSQAEVTVTQDPDRMRPSDIPSLVGDASKLRDATGWQPEITLEQSLQDILADWRQRA